MANTRYLWSVINPAQFSQQEIISLLQRTDQCSCELLQIREAMIKAGIPTFQLGTSIRDLHQVRELLLMSAFKKFRSNNYRGVELERIASITKGHWLFKLTWSERANIFMVSCRIIFLQRYSGLKKRVSLN
jgi:hypothetical protein